jgi:hypothetical protein
LALAEQNVAMLFGYGAAVAAGAVATRPAERTEAETRPRRNFMVTPVIVGERGRPAIKTREV